MPAPTWHFLNMNDATVEIPEDLQPVDETIVEGDTQYLSGADDAFYVAMEGAQAAWNERFGDREVLTNAKDSYAESLGGTAFSRYQIGADKMELDKSLIGAFETGMGETAHEYLASVAGAPTVFQIPESATASVAVRINGVDGAANTAAIDLIAEPGSTVQLVITVDSPAAGEGLVGSTLRVFAGKGAHVNVIRMQTLDPTWIDLDDTGLFLDEDAVINVHQTVLGGSNAFTGLAGDLRGENASATVVTRYLGNGTRELDFNYILRHHGKNTTCELDASGVLEDECHKCLRGTIDLIRGGKGAVGHENENVLMTDKRARNKTVPVILCNEDDVMGNHGATIGHIRPDQMFYLGARGLSEEQAQAMFASSMLEGAYYDAPDDATKAAVVRLGSQLVDDFEEVCEA